MSARVCAYHGRPGTTLVGCKELQRAVVARSNNDLAIGRDGHLIHSSTSIIRCASLDDLGLLLGIVDVPFPVSTE